VKIETTIEKGVLVCSLLGSFDFYSATEFEKDLKARIDAGDRRIIVDLKNARLLDSHGIGAIIKISSLAHNSGGDLKMVGMTDMVLHVFGNSGLKMHNYESVEAALNAFIE